MRRFIHSAFLFATLSFQPLHAWEPGLSNLGGPVPTQGFVVDTSNRSDVLSFWHCVYQASEGVEDEMGWSGDVSNCVPGEVSQAYLGHTQRRVNYFRAMAGITADIEFVPEKNGPAQAAALIMASQNSLSHNPRADFNLIGAPTDCWTQAGEDGAAGELSVLVGPQGINNFIEDPGANNAAVGHRRKVLFPEVFRMGSGNVPATGTNWAASVLRYSLEDLVPDLPGPQWHGWPSPGFVPAPIVYARWSMASRRSGFLNAVVTMTDQMTGAMIPTTVVHRDGQQFNLLPAGGITWRPDWSAYGGKVPINTPLEVKITGIEGPESEYTYSVTIIDPDTLGTSYKPTGPESPGLAGAEYCIEGLPEANAYEFRVSKAIVADQVWGAEGADATILDDTPFHDLRADTAARTGTYSFQLASVGSTPASFELGPTILPGPDAFLRFHQRLRFALTQTRFDVDVYDTNRASWTNVWSRFGTTEGEVDSTIWDNAWNAEEISLAAFADTTIRLRFRLSDALYSETSIYTGMFIDDIELENSRTLVELQQTTQNDATFTLNAEGIGEPGPNLPAAQTYYLQARVELGCHWFPYGPALEVHPRGSQGFEGWILDVDIPAGVSGPSDDADRDGLPNLLEYAFGLDPINTNAQSELPRFIRTNDTVFIRFNEPEGVSGILYSLEMSTDLDGGWTLLEDQAEDQGEHMFSARIDPMAFLRIRVEPE